MWNYAKLSKLAKLNGGPEKLVNIIAKEGVRQGIKTGRLQMIPFAIGAFLIGLSIKPIYDYIQGKKAKSIAEYEAARAELIQGIKDYDAAHPEGGEEDE